MPNFLLCVMIEKVWNVNLLFNVCTSHAELIDLLCRYRQIGAAAITALCLDRVNIPDIIKVYHENVDVFYALRSQHVWAKGIYDSGTPCDKKYINLAVASSLPGDTNNDFRSIVFKLESLLFDVVNV